jgi:hypothetical protein
LHGVACWCSIGFFHLGKCRHSVSLRWVRNFTVVAVVAVDAGFTNTTVNVIVTRRAFGMPNNGSLNDASTNLLLLLLLLLL